MQQTDPQTNWIDVDGISIHYLKAGESGSPVVLLHGGGLDSATLSWSGVIGPLATRHWVFAPDLPGYGKSSKPDIHYTLDFYANFVIHLLDVLHLEKVSLVGLSMGGAISLAVTLHSPARVEKLVLVDTYGIQDKIAAHRLSYLYVHLPFLDELSYWLIGRSRSFIRWSLLAGLIYNPANLSNELVEQVYQTARAPEAGKAFISLQRNDLQWNGLSSDFRTKLSEITAPTLIIHGAADTAVPLSYAQRAQTLLQNAELYIMQKCKHWPQRENPQEFNGVVEKFLQ